jgi:hypothetical protein
MFLSRSLGSRLICQSLHFLFWSVVFGTCCTQAPLYYSNQHQYLLHGLAAGGRGFLDEDWLANTADPTPLFSLLVACTQRYLPEEAFHLYYLLQMGVYFQALLGLFHVVAGERATPRLRTAFIVLILLSHSAALRLLGSHFLGRDYAWYLQAGLAGQYVLGPVFQPSTFGVWLLLAAWLFLSGRPFLAVLAASFAAVVHSTYLLPAGLLTLAFLIVLWRDGRRRDTLLAGSLALGLVLPTLHYVLGTFAPTSPAEFAEAQAILVEYRIPHHAVLASWFDAISAAQIAWMLAALVLVRGTRALVVLGIPFVLALGLSLLQWQTGNHTLALLFPWRTSAWLVPAATAVIFTRLLLALAAGFPRLAGQLSRLVSIAGPATVLLLFVSGLIIQHQRWGYRMNWEELPMLAQVKAQAVRGDVYLIPVERPKAPMSNNSPLSAQYFMTQPANQISYDLQRFRLFTGAPIFVDFKAIPYKDVEVLEWHRRVAWNQEVQERLRVGNLDGLTEQLRKKGITHVVTRAETVADSAGWEQVYADGYYRVYRLPRNGN